jgi:PIN domain nuclease of toxin-antitoxin system
MILLDTHIWLEFMSTTDISQQLLDLLEDPRTPVFVSYASFWELSIKASVGKIQIPTNLIDASIVNGIVPLPVDLVSINRIQSLPLHHRDPFDRLLICTAITHNLLVISRDSQFAAYEPELKLESKI